VGGVTELAAVTDARRHIEAVWIVAAGVVAAIVVAGSLVAARRTHL
jgi:hypothetical protein